MISPSQLIHGVEGVWLIWLGAVVVVLKMSWQALRRWRRPRWAELAQGEEGVSYSLSYVLLMPVYLLFVCIVFEATWLLMAKIGTLYAAHAGARSAVVWVPAQGGANIQTVRTNRINQSVWTAMTPFVTGSPGMQLLPNDAGRQAREYIVAYNLSNGGNPDPNAQPPAATLNNRYLTAALRTTWTCPQFNNVPANSAPMTVTVTYRAPLHIPGAGRILAPGSRPPYEYLISSSATLPSEAPANDQKKLGINYQSR